MARTVDPARHAMRRLAIIDAALTCLAREGYAGATTSAICAEAGIGSGTFFHYFPTKIDVVLAILELGTAETVEWFAAQEGRADPHEVLMDWVRHTADELDDVRVAGFVRAIGAVLAEPDVVRALAADEVAQQRAALAWVESGQRAGVVRTDLTPTRLASWILLITDGFIGRLNADPDFQAAAERDLLVDTVERLLAP